MKVYELTTVVVDAMNVVVAAEVPGTTVVVVDAMTVVVAAEVSGTTVVVVGAPPLLDDLEDWWS